jgi:DNA invertase Pin-like site-specific DNA recombinase
MKIGYARVQTHEQNLSLQEDALKQVGYRKNFHDWVDHAARRFDRHVDFV